MVKYGSNPSINMEIGVLTLEKRWGSEKKLFMGSIISLPQRKTISAVELL